MEISDPLLPAVAHLVGPGARALFAPVVSAHGGEIVDLRPGQVAYRPDHDLVVSYGASVRWSGGPVVDETLLAATTRSGPPAGAICVEADGMSVGVWRYPFDPALPGLDTAVRADALGAVLGQDPAELQVSVRSFRPSRRAVVEVVGRDRTVFVKVLPPERIAAVVERHRVLRGAGVPVPEVLLVDDAKGLVVLASVPGTELRTRLLHGGALPTARSLHDLVSAVAVADLPPTDRPRPGLVESAVRHAAVVRRIAPDTEAMLDEIVDRIDALGLGLVESAGAHGDLHDGQIFVDGRGRVSGIIDVDDAGLGDPLDDLARPVAHLVALAVALRGGGTADRRALARTAAYCRQLDGGLRAHMDPQALRGRVAAALVGLASGPFRAQDADWEAGVARLVRSARSWARLAANADERTLRPGSSPGHAGSRQLT